jgi:hypothetical protein
MTSHLCSSIFISIEYCTVSTDVFILTNKSLSGTRKVKSAGALGLLTTRFPYKARKNRKQSCKYLPPDMTGESKHQDLPETDALLFICFRWTMRQFEIDRPEVTGLITFCFLF